MAEPNVSGAVQGTLAAKAAAVTDASANQIADWRGDASVNIGIENTNWSGQSIYVQETITTLLTGSMNFSEVAYKSATLATTWGITGAGSTTDNTLEATPASATIYTFDNTITNPVELEWLNTVQVRNNSNKKLQIWAGAGILADGFNVFSHHGDFVRHDISVDCFLDASNKLFEFIVEN